MKDYYSLLGIESSATTAEIKKNYRLLATKFHPDKNSAPESAEKFIAITEAYDVLSNKKSRARYDLIRWQELKRQKESKDDYAMVVPPRESTRTRRNKAQRKRSLKYHEAKNESQKLLQLVVESFYIVSRYVLHILGFTLLGVILFSSINQLPDAFEKGIIRGVVIAVLIGAIIYGIVWICQNIYLELKKDLEAFSVFYKISQKNAATFSISIFAFVLLLYVVFLKVSF